MQPGLAAETFTAGSYIEPFVAEVARLIAAERPRRVLDIGCGDGSLLLVLARTFPEAKLTGVDISERNIELARSKIAGAGIGDRCTLETSDYLACGFEPFDLIVSHSTLHLIDTETPRLARKISADLAPGGLLIATAPVRCLFNRLLLLARRGMRPIRSRRTDAFILSMAKLIFRARLDEHQLAQRVQYMYVIPAFLWSARIERCFSDSGLASKSIAAERHASIAQPKHVRIVLRKV